MAPFIAGYASLVAVLGSSVRHLRQLRIVSDRKPKLGQTGAGTYCLSSPISQVTRCVSGVSTLSAGSTRHLAAALTVGTVADDLEIGTWQRSAFKVDCRPIKSLSRPPPPLPDICAPLAEKPGEQVWVIAERLICEAFDSRPKHVAVNRGPVDPTEGRAGVVFDRELHQSGHFVARQPAGKAQGRVDACGHAGTRQISAILDPAFCDVPRSQPVKESTVCPVSGGGATLQEAGSGEQQGACAHRGHDLGGAVGLPHIVEEDWIRQLAKRGGAASWNEDDIRRGNVVEGV